jgi:hypothetical protein
MKTTIKTSKTPKVIAMSAKTKGKIAGIAASLKGKELFADKIELAKKSLRNLKSLPI